MFNSVPFWAHYLFILFINDTFLYAINNAEIYLNTDNTIKIVNANDNIQLKAVIYAMYY